MSANEVEMKCYCGRPVKTVRRADEAVRRADEEAKRDPVGRM